MSTRVMVRFGRSIGRLIALLLAAISRNNFVHISRILPIINKPLLLSTLSIAKKAAVQAGVQTSGPFVMGAVSKYTYLSLSLSTSPLYELSVKCAQRWFELLEKDIGGGDSGGSSISRE